MSYANVYMALVTITEEVRTANREAIDELTTKFSSMNTIIAKMKGEIRSLCNKFVQMKDYLATIPIIPEQILTWYGLHTQSFMYSLDMFLSTLDSEGNKVIPVVTPTVQTTTHTLTVQLLVLTMTDEFITNNISIDLVGNNLNIGSTSIHALTAAEIAAAKTTLDGENHPVLLNTNFIAGVTDEIEKLCIFNAQLARLEHQLTGRLRFLSEIKTNGFY